MRFRQLVLVFLMLLGPRSRVGLHLNEVTIADLLKTAGYATQMVGKWVGLKANSRPVWRAGN